MAATPTIDEIEEGLDTLADLVADGSLPPDLAAPFYEMLETEAKSRSAVIDRMTARANQRTSSRSMTGANTASDASAP